MCIPLVIVEATKQQQQQQQLRQHQNVDWNISEEKRAVGFYRCIYYNIIYTQALFVSFLR